MLTFKIITLAVCWIGVACVVACVLGTVFDCLHDDDLDDDEDDIVNNCHN